MYRIYWMLFVVLMISACDKNQSAPGEDIIIGTGDISGYQLEEIPGSDYQRALKYDESGFLVERGQVKSNQKTGTWVTYHPGGSYVPKSIINYTDGVANGPYFEFNTQGQMEMRAFYVNNKLDGEWATYKFNRPTKEAFYKDGVLNGILRDYRTTTGKVQREVEYKDGEMNGKFLIYDENEEVILEYEYKNGEKVEN